MDYLTELALGFQSLPPEIQGAGIGISVPVFIASVLLRFAPLKIDDNHFIAKVIKPSIYNKLAVVLAFLAMNKKGK